MRKRYFKYRCNTGCGKVPCIREETILYPVWDSVVDALTNPALIEAHSSTLISDLSGASTKVETSIDRTAIIDQLDEEESRIIAAYRTKALSAKQLAEQLESLSIRKNAIPAIPESPIQQIRKWSVKDINAVCAQFRNRLSSPEPEMQTADIEGVDRRNRF